MIFLKNCHTGEQVNILKFKTLSKPALLCEKSAHIFCIKMMPFQFRIMLGVLAKQVIMSVQE